MLKQNPSALVLGMYIYTYRINMLLYQKSGGKCRFSHYKLMLYTAQRKKVLERATLLKLTLLYVHSSGGIIVILL